MLRYSVLRPQESGRSGTEKLRLECTSNASQITTSTQNIHIRSSLPPLNQIWVPCTPTDASVCCVLGHASIISFFFSLSPFVFRGIKTECGRHSNIICVVPFDPSRVSISLPLSHSGCLAQSFASRCTTSTRLWAHPLITKKPVIPGKLLVHHAQRRQSYSTQAPIQLVCTETRIDSNW